MHKHIHKHVHKRVHKHKNSNIVSMNMEIPALIDASTKIINIFHKYFFSGFGIYALILTL